MSKKLTREDFILKAKKIHGDKYDYSKVIYVNNSTKVCIICPEHGEFWQRPANHLQGSICPKCSSESVHKKQSNGFIGFVEKAKQVHGDKYDYSKVEYVNNKTKVCIICPVHGEFWQRPDKHLQKHGCPKCGGTKNLTIDEFVEKAREIHGDKYNYSKVVYTNYKSKICIICPEHGEFWQTPHSHLQGQGCPKCCGLGKTTQEWINEAKLVHEDKYDYSKVEYVDSETKVCINCSKHGAFYQTPHNHLQGQGCPDCQSSKLSQVIERKLKNYNISFSKEKTFDWLKNKGHLFLDFYLPEYNIAIECQGIQHFEPIEYFGGEEAFKNRKKLDQLKHKLCNDHGIKIYYFSLTNTSFVQKIYTNEEKLIEEIWNTVK